MNNVELSQQLVAVDLRYVWLAVVVVLAVGFAVWRGWAMHPRNRR
jgi:hypothetical protein